MRLICPRVLWVQKSMQPVVLPSRVVLVGLVVCLMLWRCCQVKQARTLWLSAASFRSFTLGARAACSEARHALAWERVRLARHLSRRTACSCQGAWAARPQISPKHGMHLSGSAGSLPATYLEARHVLNFYF